MYCKKCGAQIPEGSKFCQDCGNSCENTNSAIYAKPIETPNTNDNNPEQQNATPQVAVTTKSKKRKNSIITAAVVIGILIIIINSINSNDSDKAEKIVYTYYNFVDLQNELDTNALRAKENFEGKYIGITGRIRTINANAEYFSIEDPSKKFSFDSIICEMESDVLLDKLIKVNEGDIVTVKGKITSVGNFSNFIMDAYDIEYGLTEWKSLFGKENSAITEIFPDARLKETVDKGDFVINRYNNVKVFGFDCDISLLESTNDKCCAMSFSINTDELTDNEKALLLYYFSEVLVSEFGPSEELITKRNQNPLLSDYEIFLNDINEQWSYVMTEGGYGSVDNYLERKTILASYMTVEGRDILIEAEENGTLK